MKIFTVILVVLFSSCCAETTIKTVYSLNGVSVTRFDKFGTTYIYYGDYKKNDPDTSIPHIKVTHQLGSDIMEGYLVFKENKKVTLVAMTSNFVQEKPDSSMVIFSFKENVDFNLWEDSVKNNFENLIRISENLELEDRLYKQFGSKVQLVRKNCD